MKIIRLDKKVPYDVMGPVLALARDNAQHLSSYPIELESPLIGLARAEVHEKLGSSLAQVEHPVTLQLGRQLVRGRSEVILAVDETINDGRLAGFLDYKVRVGAEGSVSIGRAVVAPEYRGQGVLRLMIEELFQHYSAADLDCALPLVSLYERFGFRVVCAQGSHVAMVRGQLEGKNWMLTEEELNSRKSVVQAKAAIRNSLGKATRAAYAKRDADERAEAERVAQFIQAQSLSA